MKRLNKNKGPSPAPAPAPAPTPQAASLLQAGQPVAERKAPKDRAVTWINGPRGPQPDFVTQGGMDESIYGWCDTMYDMMRTKAIDELDEEQKKQKEKKNSQDKKDDDED